MIKKSLSFAIIAVLFFVRVAEAVPEDDGSVSAAPVPEDFSRTVQSYLRAKFKGEAESYYADTVVLLPGHEYLKAEYGISADGDRSKAVTATRKQVIDVDESKSGTVPPDRVEALLGRMKLETTRVAGDKGLTVGEADGKGKMTIPSRAGDVVVVARFEGMDDFLAFVFRPFGNEWKVAAEYLD